MANPRTSWRDRRWKIFENAYKSDKEFREELDTFWKNNRDDPANNPELDQILADFSIPRYCLFAVIVFLDDPNCDRKEYLKYIIPPILFWNPKQKELGPTMGIDTQEWLRLSIEKSGLTDQLKDVDLHKLMEAIAGDFTVLLLSPYLKKSDLEAIMNDYYGDLEPYLMVRSERSDSMQSEQVLSNIHSKTNIQMKREKEVARLYRMGYNDLLIATELNKQELGTFEANNIKQIRFRLGLTKKRKQS